MYEVDKLIDEVESALHKMDECGLDAWSSDRVGVEILPCHKNFLTGGEYVLHVFFFTREADVYGCHVFDISSEKYVYNNYKERIKSVMEEAKQ